MCRQARRLVCDIARANRDERRFADPGRLDPARPRRPDLTFGSGPHRCPGAGLSLVVIEHALRTLLGGYEMTLAGEAEVSDQLVGERHGAVPVHVARRRS